MRKLFSVLIILSSLSSLCVADRLLPEAAVTLAHGDSRVGTYVSDPKGFTTSSYWIEGPKGLIFIDTQFLLSSGEEALNWAEKVTGKKVVLAIILHPNPDKFNGTVTFKKRGIRVITSEQVLKLIPEVHKDRHHWFYERYKPDYPNEVTLPESFGSATQDISAGGITFKAHVFGAGCSGAHVVIEYDKHLFPGDLVTNGFHSWIELGKLEEWIGVLNQLEALHPEFVHPGRGPSGGPELLVRQKAYLDTVRDLVKAEQKKHPKMVEADDNVLEQLQKKIIARYPGYELEHFIEIGLPEVWNRQKELSKK